MKYLFNWLFTKLGSSKMVNYFSSKVWNKEILQDMVWSESVSGFTTNVLVLRLT